MITVTWLNTIEVDVSESHLLQFIIHHYNLGVSSMKEVNGEQGTVLLQQLTFLWVVSLAWD